MIESGLYNLTLTIRSVLEDEHFNNNNFKNFSKLVTSRKNIQNLQLFLEELYNHKSEEELEKSNINYTNTKKFFSIYVLLFYPELNNVNLKLDICRDLKNICKQLKLIFKSLLIFISNYHNSSQDKNKYERGFVPSVKSFFIKYNTYLELFDSWKLVDLEHIIFNLSLNYFNLEQGIEKKKNQSNFIEFMDFFRLEKRKIKSHVRELDPQNGIFKFEDYLDIVRDYFKFGVDLNNELNVEELFISKINDIIKKNVKVAYWDLLEEEIENKNYAKLAYSIKDLNVLIKSCVPNKKDIHLELDEYLDEKFIIEQIENKVYSKEQLQNLCYYIIGLLEKFQSEYEDEYTDEFKKELADLFLLEEDFYTLSFVIRFFLENITFKFENVVSDREYFMKILQQNK